MNIVKMRFIILTFCFICLFFIARELEVFFAKEEKAKN